MKCKYCDNEVPDGKNRCPSCGGQVVSADSTAENKPLSVQVQVVPAPVPQQLSQTTPAGIIYAPARQKSRVAYIVLAIFLGEFGVHDFYAGYAGRGVAQLLITILSCGFLLVVSWIWALIEAIVVDKDSNGIPLI